VIQTLIALSGSGPGFRARGSAGVKASVPGSRSPIQDLKDRISILDQREKTTRVPHASRSFPGNYQADSAETRRAALVTDMSARSGEQLSNISSVFEIEVARRFALYSPLERHRL